MNITTWARRERKLTRQGMDEFYGRPLPETHLFSFVTSRLELPSHGGSFSLKLALFGEEEYLIGRRTVRVLPGSFLLVNGGEQYGSRIRSRTHSLSLFYRDCDVAAAQAALAVDCRHALDPAAARPAEVPQFGCRTSGRTQRTIAGLLGSLRRRRHDLVEQSAAELLMSTLRDLHGMAPGLAIDRVRKRATRDELVARVMRAHDYLTDMSGHDSSLDRLAQVACLSKFHFLRVFRQVFGRSPACFARSLRLAAAAGAIARGESEEFAAATGGYASRHSLRRAMLRSGRAAI